MLAYRLWRVKAAAARGAIVRERQPASSNQTSAGTPVDLITTPINRVTTLCPARDPRRVPAQPVRL